MTTPAYADGYTDDDGGEGTTFLRGSQVANDDGIVEFLTVYPGWYAGRAVHIHSKVHIDDATVLTTQFLFDDELNSEVMATEPYASYGEPDTTNATDGVTGGIGRGRRAPARRVRRRRAQRQARPHRRRPRRRHQPRLSHSHRVRVGSPALHPRGVAAGEVVHVGQPEVDERCDRQTRRVALLAEHHDRPIMVDVGEAVLTGGIESPFEDVAFHDHGARDLAVLGALGGRPCVDERGTARLGGGRPPERRPC